MSEITTGSNPSNPPQTRGVATNVDGVQSNNSAVSWAAILAGAAGAAALSLIMVILGSGFGFSAVSPWSMEGVSAAKIGFAAIAWLSFTQLAASGLGGYLAGRLRTKWAGVHNDEVYFRDTAHGFLTWAVATLLTAALLTTAVGSIVSGVASAGSKVIGGAADSAVTLAANSESADEKNNTIEYYIDSMFRTEPTMSAQSSGPQSGQNAELPVSEVMRIVVQALRTGNLEQQDERYIGQLIAERTDLSQRHAEQRVSEGFAELQTALEEAETAAREIADKAREASAYAALWMFIALLMGAFIASLMAVFGGRQRDA